MDAEKLFPDGPPEVTRLEGWEEIELPFREGMRSEHLAGQCSRNRFRAAFFRRSADAAIVGRIWFGSDSGGPPGLAHGGAIATVLDEAMGAVCWSNRHFVIAANLNVNFKVSVPIGTDAQVEATIERIEGRQVHAAATLTDPATGTLYAHAEGRFVYLDEKRTQQFIAAARQKLARLSGSE
jgi:acyl-coenzyme A thioesterase PaaI-like protein